MAVALLVELMMKPVVTMFQVGQALVEQMPVSVEDYSVVVEVIVGGVGDESSLD